MNRKIYILALPLVKVTMSFDPKIEKVAELWKDMAVASVIIKQKYPKLFASNRKKLDKYLASLEVVHG